MPDIHQSAGFNNVDSAAFGSPPPASVAGVMQGIQAGAAAIGGGAGGFAGVEVPDARVSAVANVVTPPPRDAFNVNQASEVGPGPRVNPNTGPSP